HPYYGLIHLIYIFNNTTRPNSPTSKPTIARLHTRTPFNSFTSYSNSPPNPKTCYYLWNVL
ncbi:hypothetical protein NDU88_000404, partial [Pleurodeles waltl]